MNHLDDTRQREVFWFFLAAMVCAFWLYRQSFGFLWTYDDIVVLVRNPDIRSFTNFFKNYYPGRPVRELTYMLDYKLFGLHPAGYHFQNIFWHALDGTLLFALIRRLGGRFWASCLAVAIFLVHPVQTEVVANIATRKDSLALAFALLSILAFIRFSNVQGRRWPWLLLTLLCYWIGYEAKQNVALLLFVYMAYEVAFLEKQERFLTRRRWPLVAGGLAGCGIFVYWVFGYFLTPRFLESLQGLAGKYGMTTPLDRWHYYLLVFKAPALLFSKVFWPVGLTPEQSLTASRSIFDPWVLSGLGLLVLFAIGLIFTYRHSKPAFVFLVMVVSFWLPVSDLLGYLSYLVAGRYLYAPMAGLAGLLAIALGRHLERPAVGAFAVVLSAGLLCPLTLRQEGVWKSPTALYTYIVQVNPRSEVALRELAHEAEARQDYRSAKGFLERCLQIDPDNGKALNDFGALYIRMGNYGAAEKYLKKAVAIEPRQQDAYFNLGVVAAKQGKVAVAKEYYRKGLAVYPERPSVYIALAGLYAEGKEYDDAEAVLRQGISLGLQKGRLLSSLGDIFLQAKMYPRAMGAYREALENSPRYSPALLGKAEVFAAQKNTAGVKRVLGEAERRSAQGAGQIRKILAAMSQVSGNMGAKVK